MRKKHIAITATPRQIWICVEWAGDHFSLSCFEKIGVKQQTDGQTTDGVQH